MNTQHPLTKAERQAIHALQERLVAVIETQDSHRLVLIAMLSLYVAVAQSNPRRQQSAGRAALQAGHDLLAGTVPDAVAH